MTEKRTKDITATRKGQHRHAQGLLRQRLLRQKLLRQRRAIFWRKFHTVRTFALKTHIHAVLQAYDTFDRICRNKTPLELVAR